MKLYKIKKARKRIQTPTTSQMDFHPGSRQDNAWMQYVSKMSPDELKAYWKRPFSVKPEMGFYGWPKPEIVLRVPDDTELQEPSFVRDAFLSFFQDKSKLEKFIELNSMEFKKGEDIFSVDKAQFYSAIFQHFGKFR